MYKNTSPFNLGCRIKRRLKRFVNYGLDYFVPKGLLLMYHRVASLKVDPWQLAVTPKHFCQHVEYLRSEATVFSLTSFAKALRQGTLPRRAVVLTFDDGYLDNLSMAAPVLEEAGLPATFFIPTEAVGMKGEFWWDDLERCILHETLLDVSQLRKLTLQVIDETHDGDNKGYRADPLTFGDIECETEARLVVYRRLWEFAFSLSPVTRNKLISRIRAATHTPLAARPTHKTLTEKDVIALNDMSGMDVGAHSVTHTPLTTLSLDNQREEIVESRREIENIIDSPVTSFSYPNGAYDENTVSILRSEGYAVACTTRSDVATPKSNNLTLPRLTVPDLDAEGFDNLIRRYW